ncbi:hypothetical protein [Schleiferia thermophila]|uniref:hypothetical protein n=1 Tax=Schleiferia thermophila TaxID=884107 RepID=UPI0004E79299|nr:hypothetical protein [Schleiferia thermophila]KFD38206.1 hypothetical protein AT05_11335 [Schleiferia thermophila str. Yellowstone]
MQIKTGLGTNIYQTIFSVAASGGDLVGGPYQRLFTSGPTGEYYKNKWAGVNVSMNTLQTYTHNTGVDNTVTLTNGKWYTVNFHNIGYVNTSAIFIETSGEPRTITSVTTSQPLTDVYPGNLTVTINLSGTPASDEYYYLRWTTDNFLTNNIAAFTISGSTGTATIAVLPNQNIDFYIFSSSISSISSGENSLFYDLRTIHFNNNGGSNYTCTVKPAYRTVSTAGTYNFNMASAWRGGVVPLASARIEIEPGVSINASYQTLTLDSIELLGSGASFDATGTQITMVNNAALIVPSGTSFTSDFSTSIEFAGTGRIPNALTLNGTIIINDELILSPGVVFNDELQIKTGGFVSSNAPVWGSNSTLAYHATTYTPGLEWSHTGSGTIGTTPGYPNNVNVGDGLNATTVNFNNLDRAMEGTLFVNTSSTFNFNNTTIAADLLTKGLNLWGTIHMNNSNRKIISMGDVVINSGGELNLSSVIGGDLEIRSGGII